VGLNFKQTPTDQSFPSTVTTCATCMCDNAPKLTFWPVRGQRCWPPEPICGRPDRQVSLHELFLRNGGTWWNSVLYISPLKGLCHQFRSSLKYCHLKATNINMWRLILTNFFTRSLNLYSSLKFLCLGSKLIQIIIFIFNMLRGCSMRIQNTQEQFSVNPIG
jgi:hypothetical protein